MEGIVIDMDTLVKAIAEWVKAVEAGDPEVPTTILIPLPED